MRVACRGRPPARLGNGLFDAIRVAELKLRASRVERIRTGFGLTGGEILELAEYMHPRVEEVVDTMPTGLGRRVFNSAIGRAVLRRLTAQGRLCPGPHRSGAS